MKIIDKYIATQVITGTILTLLVIVAINLVFAFGSESGDAGTGNYSLSKAFFYTLLTTPRRMYEVIPMACIVGALLQLGRMASGSEITAMQCSGISPKRLFQSVMKGGVVIILFSLSLSELIIPYSEPYALNMRAYAKSSSSAMKGVGGVWARDKNMFVNIKNIHPNGDMDKLVILEFDDTMNLQTLTKADRGRFSDPDWTLTDVKQFYIQENGIEKVTAAEAKWQVLLSPDILEVLSINPDKLSIWKLYTYIEYLLSNKLDAEPYRYAMWGKIAHPFSIIVMLFLSFPFVFGNTRTAEMGMRITIGITVGISYFVLNGLFVNMGAAYHLNPALSSFAPPLIFSLAGGISMKLISTR